MSELLKRVTPIQASLILILAFALLRLLAASGAGLSVDEAHYALYGLHLDWSYFDHPPMVGWLQALALRFGESDVAMRALPILLFAGASWVMHGLTRQLFPHVSPWLGFTSVALMQSAVMLQLLGLAMLPDTPLLLLGLLVLWVLHRIVIAGQMQQWVWLGVLLGLAALSKYTAITLLLTVLLALTLGNQWRQLKTQWPWLAVLIAALLIIPILYWNNRHEWISFAYQFHHGTRQATWELKRFLLAQGAQLLVYGPLIFVGGICATVYGLRQWRESGVWMCLALSLPVLLLFAWGAGFEMTLPHWTALGWVGLIPLLAYGLHHHWQFLGVRIATKVGLAYSVVALMLVFSQFISPWLLYQNPNIPLRDLYGWKQAALKAEQLRSQLEVNDVANPPQLFTDNWTYGSRLAWYARPVPVQIIDARYDQFDLWFGSPKSNARGVLVLWPDTQASPAVGGEGQFSHCELRERLPVYSTGHLLSTFSFFECDGFRN